MFAASKNNTRVPNSTLGGHRELLSRRGIDVAMSLEGQERVSKRSCPRTQTFLKESGRIFTHC